MTNPVNEIHKYIKKTYISNTKHPHPVKSVCFHYAQVQVVTPLLHALHLLIKWPDRECVCVCVCVWGGGGGGGR